MCSMPSTDPRRPNPLEQPEWYMLRGGEVYARAARAVSSRIRAYHAAGGRQDSPQDLLDYITSVPVSVRPKFLWAWKLWSEAATQLGQTIAPLPVQPRPRGRPTIGEAPPVPAWEWSPAPAVLEAVLAIRQTTAEGVLVKGRWADVWTAPRLARVGLPPRGPDDLRLSPPAKRGQPRRLRDVSDADRAAIYVLAEAALGTGLGGLAAVHALTSQHPQTAILAVRPLSHIAVSPGRLREVTLHPTPGQPVQSD